MSEILAHGYFQGFMEGGWTWFWLVAIALKVAFWGLVIWMVARFVRPRMRGHHSKGPERILAERFADGTINEQEYRTRLDVIRTAHGER